MTLEARPETIDRLTLRGAPNNVALETAIWSLTYAELEAEVGRMAHILLLAGKGQGD